MLGLFRMIFHMVLSFRINLINKKCCIQHTCAFFLLLTFLTPWESQCAVDRLWKKFLYIFFFRIIDINDKCNVRITISYYNVKHIKDNIYEAEAKGNYFRLVPMKPVHLNDREFRSYDIAGNLDKQYVLVGYHSFVKSGQHIIVF